MTSQAEFSSVNSIQELNDLLIEIEHKIQRVPYIEFTSNKLGVISSELDNIYNKLNDLKNGHEACPTGNSIIVNKPLKEAMSQHTDNNDMITNIMQVPETIKTNGQKTKNRISLDDGPGIEAISDSMAENAVLELMSKIDSVNVNGNVPIKAKTKLNEFYIFKFPPNTSSERIIDYMKKHGVSGFKNTHVIRLIPRNLDISTMTYVQCFL